MGEVVIYKPNTAVVARRQMISSPDVMGVLDTVERAVFVASTEKTIAEYADSELMAELAKAIRFIAKDVGCKIDGDNELGYLTVRLSTILRRYYEGWTLKDIKMAFEMSVTGELDDFLPKRSDGTADRGHYQQFSVDYFCKIVNAYKYRRAAVLRKANEALPPKEEKTSESEMKELRAVTKSECVKAFESYRQTGKMPDISPIAEMLYYNLLSDAGLAPEVKVTAEEQREIWQRMIDRYTGRGMIGDVRRLENEGHGAKELEYKAYALARRKALADAFRRMKEKGVELKEVLK